MDIPSPRPSQDAMREIADVARSEAARVVDDHSHAAWAEEATAWANLAHAAYVCECVLIRRQLGFVSGEPKEST